MEKGFFAGKKVLVMGLGRFGGGVDVAKFAAKAGAEVIVTDLAGAGELSESVEQLKEFSNIKFHLGGHDEKDFVASDIVVANPAVKPDNNFLKAARAKKKLITSQINIFFELCEAMIIGITGANGKSTTSSLTAHLLKAGLGQKGFKYRQVWLSGNIGNEPLLAELDKIGRDDLVVLELSSFQIEQLAEIKKSPQISLLTNLTPNHLDRHGTFEAYCAAKENIFKFQKAQGSRRAVSIFNAEDEVGSAWFEKYRKDKDRTCVKFSADDVSEKIRGAFELPGRANLSNLAAVMAIVKEVGVEEDTIRKTLASFRGLAHRLEFVAENGGVRWYNDSKATTPKSSIVALESFTQPTIIIAGGYDKHIPFDEFGEKIAGKAKAAILIGQTAGKIAKAIKATNKKDCVVEFAESLEKAVEAARRMAVAGDVVLLSPACASYDMFTNFEQRGELFARLARKEAD